MPLLREHLPITCQILEIKNNIFLIDCGEGTQVQLRKNKIKFSKVNHIFISHLHGDHFFWSYWFNFDLYLARSYHRFIHSWSSRVIKIIMLQLYVN
jgi:ribonuclease Z